jgi:hypothetical protein
VAFLPGDGKRKSQYTAFGESAQGKASDECCGAGSLRAEDVAVAAGKVQRAMGVAKDSAGPVRLLAGVVEVGRNRVGTGEVGMRRRS